jgi:hypothetical protein
LKKKSCYGLTFAPSVDITLLIQLYDHYNASPTYANHKHLSRQWLGHPLHDSYCEPFMTLSNRKGSRPTGPPRIEFLTFRRNESRFLLRSSAASLFNGSEGLGSRNKYYRQSCI